MKRKAPVTAVKSKVDSDLQDLQALLAKHNKKFKSKHTYEPRQHSARDVKRVNPIAIVLVTNKI
jgi:hypothetical protein